MDAPQIDPSWMAHAKIAFAAFCGGMLRLLFRPASSFLKTLWLLFGCVTCGYYATGPALLFFELGGDYAGAIGALLGFIGLSLAESLLRSVEKFTVLEWIHKIAGRE